MEAPAASRPCVPKQGIFHFIVELRTHDGSTHDSQVVQASNATGSGREHTKWSPCYKEHLRALREADERKLVGINLGKCWLQLGSSELSQQTRGSENWIVVQRTCGCKGCVEAAAAASDLATANLGAFILAIHLSAKSFVTSLKAPVTISSGSRDPFDPGEVPAIQGRPEGLQDGRPTAAACAEIDRRNGGGTPSPPRGRAMRCTPRARERLNRILVCRRRRCPPLRQRYSSRAVLLSGRFDCPSPVPSSSRPPSLPGAPRRATSRLSDVPRDVANLAEQNNHASRFRQRELQQSPLLLSK